MQPFGAIGVTSFRQVGLISYKCMVIFRYSYCRQLYLPYTIIVYNRKTVYL
nr:MAG TPA: hypothetical protein [Caudoviricetes sp.]